MKADFVGFNIVWLMNPFSMILGMFTFNVFECGCDTLFIPSPCIVSCGRNVEYMFGFPENSIIIHYPDC